MKQSYLGLFVILLAFTALGLLYDLTVPFFEKPDELKHFAVIQHLQDQSQLPTVEAGVYRPWDQEGTQPPLYHLLAAGLTRWLDLSDFSEPPRNPHYADDRSFVWYERGNNNLYLHGVDEAWSTEPVFLAARLARWLSLVAGLLTICLTFKLAQLVFQPADGSAGLPLLVAAVVAFMPQFLHINSAITNDSLSTTLAAGTLVLLAVIIHRGRSFTLSLLLGIVLGLGALTKLSLLYLWPLTGLVLLAEAYRSHKLAFWREPTLYRDGLTIGGLGFLLAGWWFWRNWQLYGDIVALNVHLLYRGGPLNPPPTLFELWQTELTGLELSFWAAFGAGQILLEPWLYTILRSVKYIVAVGLLIGLGRFIYSTTRRQQTGSWFNQQAGLWLMLLGWAVIIFMALLRWMQITPASWGRLLYPALPALAILLVGGLSQFYLPTAPRTRYLLPGLFSLALFSLAVISPFRYLQAAYAKTSLITEAEIPANVTPVNLIYVDRWRLIGYHLEQSIVRGGEWLPVTLYWQAIQPGAENYSVFVHLLTADDSPRKIAESNTYPDRGKWPTSMVPPGAVLVDQHYVAVNQSTERPRPLRLAIGLFEFDDPARAAKLAVNATGEPVEPIVGAVGWEPHHWPALIPTHKRQAIFGDQIRLVGYDAELNAVAGETIPLTLYWQPVAALEKELTLFIHLIDRPTQQQVAGFDGPPAYPTHFWQPGQPFIDRRQLSLPAELPAGAYDLRLGWYHSETLARLSLSDGASSSDSLTLVTISVTVPDEEPQ